MGFHGIRGINNTRSYFEMEDGSYLEDQMILEGMFDALHYVFRLRFR